MQVGIVGGNTIGQTLSNQITQADYLIILSNSRGISSLFQTLDKPQPQSEAHSTEDRKSQSPQQSAKEQQPQSRSEAHSAPDQKPPSNPRMPVVLSMPWDSIGPVLGPLAHQLAGRIMIDALNPLNLDPAPDVHKQISDLTVIEYIPGDILLETLDLLYIRCIAACPLDLRHERTAFIFGNDTGGRQTASAQMASIGISCFDLALTLTDPVFFPRAI